MNRLILLCAFAILSMAPTPVAKSQEKDDEALIRETLTTQVDAWNHGDIPAFMATYEKSPDTTFIGTAMGKGYEHILERYKRNYTSPEQMGKLTFSDLEVRLLPNSCGKADVALVTGRFHLDRSQRGEAKKDDGIFSLVWRKGHDGWKIILDHTS